MKKILILFVTLFFAASMGYANPVKESPEEMLVTEVMPGDAYIAKGTMIPGELLTAVSSGSNKAGDKISFKVLEDVAVGGVTVIAKGTIGEGYVKTAKKAGLFGKGGVIELDATNITTEAGIEVPLTMDFSKIGGDHPVELNYNNSVAGAVLSGLIPGSNQKIAAGAKITIFVPVNVDLQVKCENLAAKKSFAQPAPSSDTPYISGSKWGYVGDKGTMHLTITEVGKKKIKGNLISSGEDLLIFDQAYEADKTNQYTQIKAKSKSDGKTYMIQVYFRADGTLQYIIPSSPKGEKESIILTKQ